MNTTKAENREIRELSSNELDFVSGGGGKGGPASNQLPQESLSLNFTKVVWTYN